jgi:hypothetical protein
MTEPDSHASQSAADDTSLGLSTNPREGLARLVDGAVGHQRTVARHDAARLEHVHRVLEFAARHTASFVAPGFSGARARDLARRAAIAELAVALRMTERRVDRLASDAAVLCRQLPAVLQAMRDGELDYAQAKVVIDAVDPVTEPEVVAALDEQLAELARTANPGRLRRAARQLVERIQVDSIAARHANARSERRVELHPARDGMAWLYLLLPAADALLIKNRLCQAADRLATELLSTDRLPTDQLPTDRLPAEQYPTVPGASAPETSRPGAPVGDTESAAQRVRADREHLAEKRLDQVRADLARDLLLHGLHPSPNRADAPCSRAFDPRCTSRCP